jgi:hypothetical protein
MQYTVNTHRYNISKRVMLWCLNTYIGSIKINGDNYMKGNGLPPKYEVLKQIILINSCNTK